MTRLKMTAAAVVEDEANREVEGVAIRLEPPFDVHDEDDARVADMLTTLVAGAVEDADIDRLFELEHALPRPVYAPHCAYWAAIELAVRDLATGEDEE